MKLTGYYSAIFAVVCLYQSFVNTRFFLTAGLYLCAVIAMNVFVSKIPAKYEIFGVDLAVASALYIRWLLSPSLFRGKATTGRHEMPVKYPELNVTLQKYLMFMSFVQH